ncbi:MAG: hypothetical protein F9K18_04715 [Thermoanaerobaculia bacterium]|nr:MAG: hypothetical protein F9K18_04715 [Thermoanaerobaculia bacterium]
MNGPVEDALDTLLAVASALHAVGAPFVVSGSIASSLQGIPRSTRDVDLVADLRPEQVLPFCERLSPGFYVDPERVRHGVARRSSFNVIDLARGFKVDVCLAGDDAASRQQFLRSQPVEVRPGEAVPFASAEDVVIHKLRRYRMGGDVSERQWLDVLGVLKVQKPTIDRDYLACWAAELGVADLLARALDEAGLSA